MLIHIGLINQYESGKLNFGNPNKKQKADIKTLTPEERKVFETEFKSRSHKLVKKPRT
jgi:hypothetical protein